MALFSAARESIVNTATLIYNHPSFCPLEDFKMSAVHCFNDHLNTCNHLISEDTWSYIINELEYLMMLNSPKQSKGQLIPIPPIVLTLDDMPFDIQEKIYIIKHKLQLSDVLRQFMYRHKRYLSKIKSLENIRNKWYSNQISYSTYISHCKSYTNNLQLLIYKPFLNISVLNASQSIDCRRQRPYNKVFAYSRLLLPLSFAPSSKNACLLRLSKHDLISLCIDNHISFKNRDTKPILAKKLISI